MAENYDRGFMELAIVEAEQGYERGDFPVGAVLAFNGNLIGKVNNSNRTNNEWNSHAESLLIRTYASAIQSSVKKGGLVELYTTLEPCLMCLGSSALNRISRIVYACPDPNGGAAEIDVEMFPEWYKRKWPKIEKGDFRNESYNLLVNYMGKNETWKKVLKSFEKMHDSLEE